MAVLRVYLKKSNEEGVRKLTNDIDSLIKDGGISTWEIYKNNQKVGVFYYHKRQQGKRKDGTPYCFIGANKFEDPNNKGSFGVEFSFNSTITDEERVKEGADKEEMECASFGEMTRMLLKHCKANITYILIF